MSRRLMFVLGVLIIIANLMAMMAVILTGQYGLIPVNLFGVGLGVWETLGLAGAPERFRPHE